MTKVVVEEGTFEDQPVRFHLRCTRFGRALDPFVGEAYAYYDSSGLRAMWQQRWLGRHRLTFWKPDGTVDSQSEYNKSERRDRSEGPWWWGVSDQEQPADPE